MANFEFKPFDKVLVRNSWRMWVPAIYSMKGELNHLTSVGWQDECIPYEGNEEYIGTTKDYVDKVSKFKVGNWLVENEPNNYARFVQILEIVDIQGKKRYRVSRDINNDEDIAECRFIEKYYHPFTLQDAKPGDILADDEGVIGIYQSLGSHPDGGYNNDDSYCFLYCSYEEDGFFYADFEHGNEMETSWHIHPATKEQRDLLFQKMHEAGYVWDSKKLELKKREQKSSEWSEIEPIIQHLDNLGNTAMADILRSFEPQPKQEWSERDKEEFQIAIDTLVEAGQHDSAHWLKSLKERVQPQLKREWRPSEEQIIALNCAITTADEKWVCMNTKDLESLYEDLKKLREE